MNHRGEPYRRALMGRRARCVLALCVVTAAILCTIGHRLLATASAGKPPEDLETERLFGYIDRAGKVAIPAKYEHATDFHEGLAVVRDTNGFFGYIDKSGKTVLPFKYAIAGCFSEGLAAVDIADQSCYIDRSGNVVLRTKYMNLGAFSEGLAPVQDDSGKWGYIDKSGLLVIKPRFFGALGFKEGLALIAVGDKLHRLYGYIDKTGREIIKPQYDSAEPFSEGLAPVSLRQGGPKYIDKSGRTVLSLPEGYQGSSFSEGLAFVDGLGGFESIEGFIDRSGRFAFRMRGLPLIGGMKPIRGNPPDVSFRGSFHGGLAPALVGMDHVGFVDKTGRLVRGPIVGKEVGDFSEGMARFAADVPISEARRNQVSPDVTHGIPGTTGTPKAIELNDPVPSYEKDFDDDLRDVIVEPKENWDDDVKPGKKPK